MNHLVRFVAFACFLGPVLGCGNTDIIAPEPLAVVDTLPGNGSIAQAGDTLIVAIFSEDVDPSTLASALTLEQTTPGGVTVQGLPIRFSAYERTTFTARFAGDPFPAEAFFRLTVHAAGLRGISGARLRADLVRGFRTTAD